MKSRPFNVYLVEILTDVYENCKFKICLFSAICSLLNITHAENGKKGKKYRVKLKRISVLQKVLKEIKNLMSNYLMY